eukprot:m.59866 g.59866  ORF g.59866 m.59866 type:complete len:545 (+) comp7245_c0_seq1:190-1824(+)
MLTAAPAGTPIAARGSAMSAFLNSLRRRGKSRPNLHSARAPLEETLPPTAIRSEAPGYQPRLTRPRALPLDALRQRDRLSYVLLRTPEDLGVFAAEPEDLINWTMTMRSNPFTNNALPHIQRQYIGVENMRFHDFADVTSDQLQTAEFQRSVLGSWLECRNDMHHQDGCTCNKAYCFLSIDSFRILNLMMSISPSMAHKRVQDAGDGAWLIRSTSAIVSNIRNSTLFTITRLRSERNEACSHRILHLEGYGYVLLDPARSTSSLDSITSIQQAEEEKIFLLSYPSLLDLCSSLSLVPSALVCDHRVELDRLLSLYSNSHDSLTDIQRVTNSSSTNDGDDDYSIMYSTVRGSADSLLSNGIPMSPEARTQIELEALARQQHRLRQQQGFQSTPSPLQQQQQQRGRPLAADPLQWDPPAPLASIAGSFDDIPSALSMPEHPSMRRSPSSTLSSIPPTPTSARTSHLGRGRPPSVAGSESSAVTALTTASRTTVGPPSDLEARLSQKFQNVLKVAWFLAAICLGLAICLAKMMYMSGSKPCLSPPEP